ncbi:ATP-binding cassette (ABC) Superfamily [Phytophthora palmivora]|uniref:ATP-binding cassette (ABC) Superfamily n=1 Tax=Phytophthora palmivora TaxID=4796 RepID=A0A2P4YG78_9STRA|nr:ATP-binding cassette (ABC) Superfamily [Phytophthora palmivora]
MDSSDSSDEEMRVTASHFETWHDNWEVFFTRLEEYQIRTSQLYRVRTTVKASARNQVITAKKKWGESELIPEKFGDYFKKLLCAHAWDTSNKGRGLRNGHHSRSTGCELHKNIFAHYPSNRKVIDPDVLDLVEELIKVGGKPKKILKYLQETTDYTASVFTDDSKMTQTITLQTRQMRRFFEAFPEVLMLDSTHGTNSSKYKLFSFMIDDVFGHTTGATSIRTYKII